MIVNALLAVAYYAVRFVRWLVVNPVDEIARTAYPSD